MVDPATCGIDWDGWRARYADMSYADHCHFYDEVERLLPEQRQYAGRTVRNFLLYALEAGERPLQVVEVGGWKGHLAQEVLGQSEPGEIASWKNYDLSQRAVDRSVCGDERYRAVVLPDFVWNVPGCFEGANVVVSHAVEHLASWDCVRFIGALAEARVRFCYVEAPIPEETPDEGVKWDGYGGSHILEVGWDLVEIWFSLDRYVVLPSRTRADVRCFERK